MKYKNASGFGFQKSLLDLLASEGPETVPSRIATAPECSSVEMESILYGLHLQFSKDQYGFQHNLGSRQVNQDGPLHSSQVNVSSGSMNSIINQGDSTLAWGPVSLMRPGHVVRLHGVPVSLMRPGHQVHLSVLEKSLESTRNPVKV